MAITLMNAELPLPAFKVASHHMKVQTDNDAGAGFAAEQFESLFILQMMRSAHASLRAIRGNDGFHHDESTQALRDHMDSMMAEQLASSRAFGMADLILDAIDGNVGAASSGSGGRSI